MTAPSLLNLPDFTHESAAHLAGRNFVAGVDEVGRGPLAGPVVAAAVILDPDQLPQGVDDSKRLSQPRRQQAFAEIVRYARSIGVASLPAQEIDRVNIRQASLMAMKRALFALEPFPDFALIDGRDLPPLLPFPATALIQGDRRCLSIASASIIAKVVRDGMMAKASRDFPHFGFDKHVGYGTKAHLLALSEHDAVTNLHRFSFAPLKSPLNGKRKT